MLIARTRGSTPASPDHARGGSGRRVPGRAPTSAAAASTVRFGRRHFPAAPWLPRVVYRRVRECTWTGKRRYPCSLTATVPDSQTTSGRTGSLWARARRLRVRCSRRWVKRTEQPRLHAEQAALPEIRAERSHPSPSPVSVRCRTARRTDPSPGVHLDRMSSSRAPAARPGVRQKRASARRRARQRPQLRPRRESRCRQVVQIDGDVITVQASVMPAATSRPTERCRPRHAVAASPRSRRSPRVLRQARLVDTEYPRAELRVRLGGQGTQPFQGVAGAAG
jgi:hypothetical protein